MSAKKSKLNIEWKKWWRSVEGEVSHDEGFHFKNDPDYWYFDIDPETQQEQLDEDDSRMMHVDELFTNKDDATAAAIEWCEEQEDDLIGKLQALGIWSRRSLIREIDQENDDSDDWR